MSFHLLDRPMWSALTGTQAVYAVGTGGARRYAPDVSILAGLRDDSDAALADLAALVPDTGQIMVAQTWATRCPGGARIVSESVAFQMVLDGDVTTAAHDHVIVPLGEGDWPEMLALAIATKPGPFLMRTPVLGEFWGVKRDGKLIAMAGERMRQANYAEISGICTDPTFRGEGLGRALCVHVRDRVLARGEVPYLHAYSTNETALKLYGTLGFRKRSENFVMVMENAV